MGILWNPQENSLEENSRAALLRGIEWGNWPLFLSQSVAPLLLLALPWPTVLVSVVVANGLWAFIRYRFISVVAAELGVYIVKLKWLTCPGAGAYLYFHNQTTSAILALLWPLLVIIIPGVPAKVGVLQAMVMQKFGYRPLE